MAKMSGMPYGGYTAAAIISAICPILAKMRVGSIE